MSTQSEIRRSLNALIGSANQPAGAGASGAEVTDPYAGMTDDEVRIMRFHQMLASRRGNDDTDLDANHRKAKAAAKKREQDAKRAKARKAKIQAYAEKKKREIAARLQALLDMQAAQDAAQSDLPPQPDPAQSPRYPEDEVADLVHDDPADPIGARPRNVALDVAPRRLSVQDLLGMQPVDLSHIPHADDVLMLSGAALGDPDAETMHAILLKYAGRHIPVSFQPDPDNIRKGRVPAAVGDHLAQVVFDEMRGQWTTPQQRLANWALDKSGMRDDLLELLSDGSGGMNGYIDQISETIESSIQRFYSGETSLSDLLQELRDWETQIGQLDTVANGDAAKLRALKWQIREAMTNLSLSVLTALQPGQADPAPQPGPWPDDVSPLSRHPDNA